MKKLIVFGASGGTGKEVVKQALQEGHEVTIVVRRPDVFAIQHPNLRIIKGDVLQPDTFQNEMYKQEAVISCLGVPKIQATVLYSQGMKNIVTAMKKAHIQRILCISSGAISIPSGSSWIMTFLLKNVLQRLYKPIYSDMILMEANFVLPV
jgi:putative NADH-flavin reductase